MSNTLHQVLYSLLKGAPFLAEDELVMAVYLVDWKAAIEEARTITGVTWTYAGRPTSREVWTALINDERIHSGRQFPAFKRNVFVDSTKIVMEEADQLIIDFVVNTLVGHRGRDLDTLVAGTYPLVEFPHEAQKDDVLDLSKLAIDYSKYCDEIDRRLGQAEAPNVKSLK